MHIFPRYTTPFAHSNGVVIRTNSLNTELNVNASKDSIDHYGLVGVVSIEKIASSSYHEYDTANLIQVANGRVALEKGSDVSRIHLAATNGNFDDITVAKATNVDMPDFSRDPVEIPTEGKLVVALQEGTADASAEKDYVWLTAVGVYEQVTLGTADAAGTNYAAESGNAEQKEAAAQIANNITATIGDDSYTVTAAYNTNTSEWEYNLVDENGDETAFVVEAVSVNIDEGSASASITVTGQTATAETSNSTNDTTEMANEAKNTVVEVTFHNQKTLIGMSEFRDRWNNGEFYDEVNPASIKLAGNSNLKEENWGPIGTWQYPFFGTFDGNNKTISNLTNHAAAASNGQYTHVYAIGNSVGYGETYGFFGIVAGGDTTIKDVTFDSVNINVENGKNVGAVIGYAPKQGASFDTNTISTTGAITLSGVTVNGSVQGQTHVGGIVGKIYSAGDTKFENCTNNADVTSGGGFCGGIIAILSSESNKVDAINCYNNGNITNAGDASGLFGEFAPSKSAIINVTNCHNTGTVIRNGDILAYNYGVAGVLYIAQGSTATLKDLSNSGAVSYTSNYSNTSASGVFVSGANNTILTGNIENSGNVTGHIRASGIGSFGRTQLKSVTIKNSGNVSGSNVSSSPVALATYVGGLTASFSGSLTSEGNCSFENTGNVSTNAVWGKTFAGGVFGYYGNGSETAVSFPLTVNVHDCSITAIGAGQEFHSSSRSGTSDMTVDPVGVGGFAGHVNARMVTFDKVTVDHVSFSATKTANVKVYDKAVTNPGSFFFAGAFAGLLEASSGTHVYETNLTNCTLTNNSFSATSNGLVVGCSYNSNTTNPYVILHFAGTVDAETETLKYAGRVYNNATIELAE